MLNLLTPFSTVPRRSSAYDATANGGLGLITGRWAVINSSGLATLPAAGVGGAYLVLEGNTQPDPTVTTTIGAGPAYLPAPLVSLPSSVAAGQVALAYGVFRYAVDIEGFDPASLIIGSPLQVDAVGRAALLTGTNIRIGTVEG